MGDRRMLFMSIRRPIEKLAKKEKIAIEFSSPNIAKPFHFGHLKSTILGNYLANLNVFLGNEVTKINYIGDWGTQYGILSLGLERLTNGFRKESITSLRELLDIYVKANELAETDEKFRSVAKQRFLEMEQFRDPIQMDRWRDIRALSMKELINSYSQLGIEFDLYDYESNYTLEAKLVVNQMEACGFARRLDDGVMVASVEKNGRSREVPVMKSDGTSLYLSRDVAAAIRRQKELKFDKMLYVMGADQEKHAHDVCQIIQKLGLEWHQKLLHVKIGKVIGMKTRSGNFLLLSDIIDEVTKQYVQATRQTVTTKTRDTAEVELVGHQLALASLYVYDLSNRRTKNYEFDWHRAMKGGKDSGVNLQTTHARLASLNHKAQLAGITPYGSSEEIDANVVDCIEADSLLNVLQEFQQELLLSQTSHDASPVVRYAIKLCSAINRARKSDNLRVLLEPDSGVARSRLSLFECARDKLASIIKLLGLTPLDRV